MVSVCLMWLYHLKAITGRCCSSFQPLHRAQYDSHRAVPRPRTIDIFSFCHSQYFLASGPSMPDSVCAKDGQKKEGTNFWVSLIYSKMIQHYSSQKMLLKCELVIMLIGSLISSGNEGSPNAGDFLRTLSLLKKIEGKNTPF